VHSADIYAPLIERYCIVPQPYIIYQ